MKQNTYTSLNGGMNGRHFSLIRAPISPLWCKMDAMLMPCWRHCMLAPLKGVDF
ncbi:MAG: hypothetical protein ACRC9V_07295 [Aeromonas sp.]